MKSVAIFIVAALALCVNSASAQFYGADSSEKVHSALVTPISSVQATPFTVKITTGTGGKFQSIPTPFIVTLAPVVESANTLIEEMVVSAVVGDSITISRRAVSNTTKQAWVAGSYFGVRVSYAIIKQLQDTLKIRFAKNDSIARRNDSVAALLPTMSGHTNNLLSTNGSALVWVSNAFGFPDSTGHTGQFLRVTPGGGYDWLPATGTGTVTSVGLALPAMFTVTNSPVVSTGTISATLASQNSNTVFAGPASGGPAQPTYRGLVATDIPSLDAFKVTSGVLNAARLPAMIGDAGVGGTQGAVPAPQAGDATKFLRGDGTWVTAAGTGSVTSVNISGGTTGLTSSGGPITTTGTMTLGGTLAVANGGTGQTSTTAAINALLPSQATHGGQVLTTNGTNTSWSTSGSGTPWITSTNPVSPSVTNVLGSGYHQLAIGDSNSVGVAQSLDKEFALGFGNVVLGDAMAFGWGNHVTGNNNHLSGTSIAIGSGVTVGPEASIGIGNGNSVNTTSTGVGGNATGEFAMCLSTSGAEGNAAGNGSIQIGNRISTGGSSIGMNGNTTGLQSLNLGSDSPTGPTQTGSWMINSFAGATTYPDIQGGYSGTLGGISDTVSGNYSAAIVGHGLKVFGYGAIALGQFNDSSYTTRQTIYDATGPALVVGNGTSGTARSNAFKLTYDSRLFAGATQVTNTTGKVLQSAIEQNGATSGQVLNWTGSAWAPATITGTGTVTSVAVSGGTTGLTTSGGPITGAGTITLAGTLGATNGGTGTATYATGDLLYASATNTLSKLAAGTNGFVLTLAAGVPTWAAASGGGAVSSVFTRTGAVVAASGDYTAAQVTNAVDQTGSYANPSWITSLAGSKITGNITGNAANVTGTVAVTNGGNGLTSATLGDMRYASAANTIAALPGNTTSTKKFLSQTGTGTVSAAPAWGQPAFTDITGTATTAQIPTIPATQGGTNLTTYTTGDLLYASATNVLSKLAIGSTGNVLKVVAGVPAWGSSSAPTYIAGIGTTGTFASTSGFAGGDGATALTGTNNYDVIVLGDAQSSGVQSMAVNNIDLTNSASSYDAAPGNNAVSIGYGNIAGGSRCATISGKGNIIGTSTNNVNCVILGGGSDGTYVGNQFSTLAGKNSYIIGGGSNYMNSSYSTGMLGTTQSYITGASNGLGSAIIGGWKDTVDGSGAGAGPYGTLLLGGVGLKTDYTSGQVVIGGWNATVTGGATGFAKANALLLVGNGSTGSARSNAFELYGTGELKIKEPGGGLSIKSGTNCKMGTATLAAGVATVTNSSVTANSMIFLTTQIAGGTQGFLSVGTINAGTSFGIVSSSNTDTSTVGYLIVEKL